MSLYTQSAEPHRVWWSLGGEHPVFTTSYRMVSDALQSAQNEWPVPHAALALLDESDLKSLLASMDKAARRADEAATDRVAERVMNHAEERDL